MTRRTQVTRSNARRLHFAGLLRLSFAQNRSGGKPCSIIALANEMNQVKGRVTIAADNHVTQRYVPPTSGERFSRTARYRCGNVGFSFRCIFGEPQVAKPRLPHVGTEARGLGIGKRLHEECARFARQAGYQKIALWTKSILHAGRHIHKQLGFRSRAGGTTS